jgi:hypothetical protein
VQENRSPQLGIQGFLCYAQDSSIRVSVHLGLRETQISSVTHLLFSVTDLESAEEKIFFLTGVIGFGVSGIECRRNRCACPRAQVSIIKVSVQENRSPQLGIQGFLCYRNHWRRWQEGIMGMGSHMGA